MRPFTSIGRLERVRALDIPAGRLGAVADALLRGPGVRAVLEGRPVGHSAHPMLVQLPIGAWVSAGFLDLVPGTARAATVLTGIGVATAPPAIASGLADYRHLDRRARRVGVLHAAANVVSLAFQVRSLRERAAGRLGPGQWFGLAGTVTLAVAGLLGGHLAHRLPD